MRRLQAPNKHGLWFYSQRLSVRFLCNTPCTQTNQPVGFEPVEKVPTRDGSENTGEEGRVHSYTFPDVISNRSALSPSAKVQDKNRR